MITHKDGTRFLEECTKQISLILTSPPYDNQRKVSFTFSDFVDMATGCYWALRPGGVLVWVVADGTENYGDTLTSFKQAVFLQEIGFSVNVNMYKILNPKPNAPRISNTRDFEYMFVCYKGKPNTTNWIEVPSKYAGKSTGGSNGRQDGYEKAELRTIKATKRHSTTWEYLVGHSNSQNATPFPLQLARDAITQYSNPNDWVVDPMCGSGTVGVACVIEGRQFLGADISLERVCQSENNIAEAIVTQRKI